VAAASTIAGIRVANTTSRASIAKRPVQGVAAPVVHIAIEEVVRSAAAIFLFLVIFFFSFLPGRGLVCLPGSLAYEDHSSGRCPRKRPTKRSRKRQKIRGNLKKVGNRAKEMEQ
jgi:hypothetical protein